MKNMYLNLTQMLQGCSKRNGMTVRASNPDGEPTVNRQSRLMLLSGKKAEKEQLSPSCLLSASFPLSFRSRYLRYAAMIFCVLAMSVGQAWGDVTLTVSETSSDVYSETFADGSVLYSIDNNGRSDADKHTNNFKSADIVVEGSKKSGPALSDKRFAIKFPVAVSKVVIYGYNGSTRSLSKIYTSTTMAKNSYTEITSSTTKTSAYTTPNYNYAFTNTWASPIAANTAIWFEFSNSLNFYKIVYTPVASPWTIRSNYTDNNWSTNRVTMTGTTTVTGTWNITTAGLYEFKVVDTSESGTWYGNTGNIGCNISGWTFSKDESANCKFFASETGNYTFTFNTSTKALSVTYPTAQGKYYYKNTNSWDPVAVYRYVGGINNGWPGTIVAETETICGDTYYVTYADPGTTLIFNNNDNGSQTGNETASGNAGKYVQGTDGNDGWRTFPTYTISYAAGTGSGTMSSQTSITCGTDKATTSNTFTAPSGYQFAGWIANVDVTVGGESKTAGTVLADGVTIQNVSSDITLTAQWELIPTYDVIYNTSGGTGGSTASQTGNLSGAQVTTSSNGFTKTGYKFKWWNTAANGKGEDFYPGENVTIASSNVTLYAQWEQVESGWAYWVGDNASSSPTDIAGNGVTMRLARTADYNTDLTAASTTVNATGKHAKVFGIGADDKYVEISFTDGSPINSLTLGVATKDGSSPTIAVMYSTTSDFSSGEYYFVTPTVPTVAQTSKGTTSVNPDEANKYKYVRIYRKISTAVYEQTGGSGKTTRIYSIKAQKGVSCSTPAAPTAFSAGDVSAASATFTIADVTNVNNYDIYYSTSSTDPTSGTGATVTATSKTRSVAGLAFNTTYYAWVRSVATCDANLKSSWVPLGTGTFTTSNTAPTSASISPSNGWIYVPGEEITLTASAETTNASTTYTWYRGATIEAAKAEGAIQAARTDAEGGRTYTIASCEAADAYKYWVEISNGTGYETSTSYDIKIYTFFLYDNTASSLGSYTFTTIDREYNKISVTIPLSNINYTYQFKVSDGLGTWYGYNDATITGSHAYWDGLNSTGANVGLTSSFADDYTIEYFYNSNNVVVTYPVHNQTAGKKVYFDNHLTGMTNMYIRIGHDANSSASSAFTLVPGTANLYEASTIAWSDFHAWSIADNTGWTSTNTIYQPWNDGGVNKPDDEYAITKQTNYQQYVVDETISIIPTSVNNTEYGCTYWNVDKVSGMKTDRVTISKPSNGTITIHYTNEKGVPSSSTAIVADMNEDLAHTVILTSITTSPNTGYDAGAITINGDPYSENYVVTGTTTIAATFTPHVYSITLNKGDQGAANQSATVAYLAGELTSITHVTPNTGYTRTGYYDGETKVLNADGTFASANVTGYITDSKWTKTSNATLTAKWTPNQYSVSHSLSNVTATSGATGANAATYGTDYTAEFAAAGGYTLPDDITITIGGEGTTHYTWDASTGELTIEGAYILGNIVVTIEGESEGCTPQILSKVSATKGTSGTVTGYNDGQYAGDAVVNLYSTKEQSASLSGVTVDGYKMGADGTSIVFATLKGTSFRADDKVKIGITKKNDNRTVDASTDILTIYYGTSKTDAKALHTITGVTGAGFYEYTLTSADVTAIGSKKGIGLFRESSNGENPYVYSVEIIGCREWAVCTAPNAIAAGSVTATGATFTITDAENTNNYEIYYSTSSTAPTAETSATVSGISSKSRAVTGLEAETTYYYWVRSNCGGVTKSSWVAGTPTSFTTSAAAATHKVTYNGNGSTDGSVPTDDTDYEEGDIVTVKGNTGSLAKTGSSFVGWNTASDGTGVFYPAGYKFYMGNANVTLYAVWVTGSCTTIAEGAKNASNNAIVGTTGTVTTTGASSNSSYVKLNNDDVSSSRFDVAASAGNAPFAAGDKLTVTVHNTASKGEKTMGFKIKGKAHTASVPASSSLGIEYTLTAADIESNGAIKIARNSSDDRYEAILVERCIIGTTFTVSFDMKDHGSAIADIENVPNGSKIGAPVPEPTAADYNFGGWYKDDELSDDWDFANDQVTENTTLYAKWGNCAPTITTDPVAANYNQNDVASALTVVAATNGGGDLHYQWWMKENDLAEEDGSAIPGETGNSFTPSTALLGTSYYYCVVSNDCGNVKTNTAEVTIRDTKPDPTAVWTVAEPKHGGKGFTFSVIAKNDDGTDLWDGTLTEEMLSVSSEAVLGDVEVNNTTKTISGTYGVKASATSPVTFYLLLPATETLAAKRLDKDRSFEACAGGDGSTHDIRVLKANKNITFGGGTVYGWDNPGEGFLTASTGGTVSTAKAGTKMESVFDTVYNTNKKAFWVMPYAAGIKKIKVYGDVRVKELVVSNVRKVTSFTSGKDANNIAFSAAYEGGGDNVASTGYHWFEIILEDALDANDIIYFTVSENFQISGVRVTEGTSSGSLYTSLEWSNSQSDGATLVKREDDVDFAVTANRNDANALASLGTISYSSSNTSVATVNAATGQVTIADNIDFGSADYKTTTITATLAASGCYKRCVLTYVLQVNKYVCTEAVGTVRIKTDYACSGKELEVSGYEEGATIQWYKDGTAILSETGTTYTATTAGAYYAVTHKDCDAVSNEITINFGAATATKIVDEWYVKNDRRTPDIALVQTTNATGFTVTISDAPVTSIGGCTFELKEDGIIYLHGTQDNGDAPSGMTPGDMTITITATACSSATPLDIVLHIQAETTNPSVAFVVDGTLRKDGGTATSVLAAKTSDRPLWKYLENTFTLTGCNAYWSVDSKELRQYYSQFDAILITDDPSTSTSGTGGVSYVKAFGTMVDVRPVLTMEAYVGKFKDGGWHVYDATPTSPNPRQVELKLECKNHDIFKGLNPATSDNVRTTTDEYGNEYWHVIMVDTTQSPYHNTTSNYEALPALQGFDPNKFDKMLGVGTIFDGKLQGGVERQEEPAARMMILGIQNNAMGALTNEGKLIVKNALEYLLKTNMEDVNDCSNYFVGGTDGHEREWHNSGNWTGGQLPDFETRARILAPVEISTAVRVAHIDIITDGESGKVANPEGSVTVKPTGTLIVGGTINRAKAPYYGIDDLMPTTPSNLILETSSTSQSALIFDNSNGETQATVTVHSEAHYDAENDKDYWQYLTSPLQETPVTEFFYGVGTYTFRHCEAEGGWVRYGLGTTFQAFDAIGLTQNDKKDFVFYGPLAPTGEWELNLTKEHSGNNLFGNSWTAPIDLKALVNNTDFDSNIELDLAIYNTGSDRKDGSGEFDQLDNADDRPGTWHHVPLLLATFEDAGWEGLRVIPAYQAFQLKATAAATLTIDYDKCVRGSESANYNEPLRAPRRPDARQAERDIEALRIAVSDANGIAYIYLLEGEQFSEEYDNGWELEYKPNSKYGKLYAISPTQGDMMALARPSLEGTMVGFQPGESSEYTITFNETDGYYYLNDLKMEQSTLIQAGESYTFSVEEGESANRFLISSVPFNKPGIVTGVTNPDAEAPKVQKVIYNDKLYIIRGGRVFSADGQLVK